MVSIVLARGYGRATAPQKLGNKLLPSAVGRSLGFLACPEAVGGCTKQLCALAFDSVVLSAVAQVALA